VDDLVRRSLAVRAPSGGGAIGGDAIERAESYDKLSQLNLLGRTVLKPADFLEFFLS
jgi:hypothetical protein